jgi:hypothetical protein
MCRGRFGVGTLPQCRRLTRWLAAERSGHRALADGRFEHRRHPGATVILKITMKYLRWAPFYASLLLAATVILQAAKVDTWNVLTGSAAWAD